MDVLAMYNSALQVAAAFLIFIIAYLALLLFIVVCLLAAEAVHQSVAFARTSLSQPIVDRSEASLPIAEAVNRNSAFWGWTHRLSHSLAGSLKFR